MKYPDTFLCIIFVLLMACGSQKEPEESLSAKAPQEVVKKVIRLPRQSFQHQKFREAKPGDWAYHHKEQGQPYHEYIYINPVRVNAQMNKIYLLPVGRFEKTEEKLMQDCAAYLEAFFGLEVIIQNTFPLHKIPDRARRFKQEGAVIWEQLYTKYLMYKVLLPERPDDAIAYMALSKYDLYPHKSWNFVFGQASTKDRVGVSSFYRYQEGDLTEKDAYQLALMRTLKTTTHEIGHMLSMLHCIYYECNMNGSNNLLESDHKPSYLCPICVSKLSWNLHEKMQTRYQRLADYFEKRAFPDEKKFCEKSIAFLDSLEVQMTSTSQEKIRETFIWVNDQKYR